VPKSLDNPARFGAFHRVVVTQFIENVAKLEHIRLLDFDAVEGMFGE
jgi:hypothetical protein